VSEPREGALRCYLCGSTELQELTRKLRYGDGLVAYCPRCDLGMLEHEPEDLERYYDEEYRKLHGPRLGQEADYDEIFESYVDYQGERVEMLRPFLGPDKRVLDVGCSAGHFLHNVKPLAGEVVGVDYDRSAAEYAGQRLGIQTHGGDLAEAPIEQGSFDLVCAIQVMEHVPEPIEFARRLASFLKPGGVAYVEVPNLRDPLLSVYDVPAYHGFYYHRAHLFYMTGKSLRAIMERAGFESGDIAYEQDYNLLNHLHWKATDGPQPDPHAGMSAARLPVRADLNGDLRRELDDLAARFDREYKDALARHGATDNVCFVGSWS
jgi:SAM-dependent methyltransferase